MDVELRTLPHNCIYSSWNLVDQVKGPLKIFSISFVIKNVWILT